MFVEDETFMAKSSQNKSHLSYMNGKLLPRQTSSFLCMHSHSPPGKCVAVNMLPLNQIWKWFIAFRLQSVKFITLTTASAAAALLLCIRF